MDKAQYERDVAYLATLAVVKAMRSKSLISDSELVRIDAMLAEKFSASMAVRTPKLAWIH